MKLRRSSYYETGKFCFGIGEMNLFFSTIQWSCEAGKLAEFDAKYPDFPYPPEKI
jgi:hypothetical protein